MCQPNYLPLLFACVCLGQLAHAAVISHKLDNTLSNSTTTTTKTETTTTTTTTNRVKDKMRVCYFANWSPYRGLTPPLYPDEIDPSLCTHIHYAFAKIDPKTLALTPTEEHDMKWTENYRLPLYIRLYGLKRRNPALKILLAVGGWSMGSQGFNIATRTKVTRGQFISQSIRFIREWNFDGIDLDWEFPGDVARGADIESKVSNNCLALTVND
jgi:chitinase